MDCFKPICVFVVWFKHGQSLFFVDNNLPCEFIVLLKIMILPVLYQTIICSGLKTLPLFFNYQDYLNFGCNSLMMKNTCHADCFDDLNSETLSVFIYSDICTSPDLDWGELPVISHYFQTALCRVFCHIYRLYYLGLLLPCEWILPFWQKLAKVTKFKLRFDYPYPSSDIF